MSGGRAPVLEKVEGKLKDMPLSEAEKNEIRIGKKQACALKASKHQAVGKILSCRQAKAEYVGRTLGNVWCPFSEIRCKDLGRKRFLSNIHDKAVKKKALEDGPCTFNKDLIYEFKTILIWVRAYGIPMGMMSKETGDLVGDRIGEVLNVDLDDNEEAMGAFTRIKVRTDITTPLMRFRILITDDDEEEQELPNEEVMGGEEDEIEGKRKEKEKIISFEYEYLPDFCYNCGIIGHTKKACPTRSRREGARHFGPWLKTMIYKGSSSEGMNRGLSDRGVLEKQGYG
ncbi:hypothetical protein VPH35_083228 [Triticum aestivum]